MAIGLGVVSDPLIALVMSDEWQGVAPLHEYNLGAACGAFWSGVPDALGIPDTTMADGTPNGHARLRVRKGGEYTLSWDAARAKDDSGTDVYLSATKLYLDHSLLLNTTLRFTKANQFGILGFGGDRNDGYKPQFEGSAAFLLNRHVAVGAEFRSKPDNLGIASEDNAWDAFVAWAPNKHVSLTVAYVDLGNIVIRDHQRGWYASLQVGF